MGEIKNFFFHKLTLRLIYIFSAYTTSHFVAFVASPQLQTIFSKIQGIKVEVQVTDPHALQYQITGIMMLTGEFIFHFFHEKIILPKVTDRVIQQEDIKK